MEKEREKERGSLCVCVCVCVWVWRRPRGRNSLLFGGYLCFGIKVSPGSNVSSPRNGYHGATSGPAWHISQATVSKQGLRMGVGRQGKGHYAHWAEAGARKTIPATDLVCLVEHAGSLTRFQSAIIPMCPEGTEAGGVRGTWICNNGVKAPPVEKILIPG